MSRLVFPGDPEYDAPSPTRTWHYAILFASLVVMFFTFFVVGITHQPIAIALVVAALITFVVALFTGPHDPRYP